MEKKLYNELILYIYQLALITFFKYINEKTCLHKRNVWICLLQLLYIDIINNIGARHVMFWYKIYINYCGKWNESDHSVNVFLIK